MNRSVSQKFYIRKWRIEKFAFNNTFWCQGASHLIQYECKTSNCLIQKLIFCVCWCCENVQVRKKFFTIFVCEILNSNRAFTAARLITLHEEWRKSSRNQNFEQITKIKFSSNLLMPQKKQKDERHFWQKYKNKNTCSVWCRHIQMQWPEVKQLRSLLKPSWSMNGSRFYLQFVK